MRRRLLALLALALALLVWHLLSSAWHAHAEYPTGAEVYVPAGCSYISQPESSTEYPFTGWDCVVPPGVTFTDLLIYPPNGTTWGQLWVNVTYSYCSLIKETGTVYNCTSLLDAQTISTGATSGKIAPLDLYQTDDETMVQNGSGLASFQLGVACRGGSTPPCAGYFTVHSSWTASGVQPTATPTNSPTTSLTPTITPGGPTLTATITRTVTQTPTTTATPAPSEIDCGPPAYPLLNCNMVPYIMSSSIIPPVHWDLAEDQSGSGGSACSSNWATSSGRPNGNYDGYYNDGNGFDVYEGCYTTNNGSDQWLDLTVSQNVVVQTAGTLYIAMGIGSASYNCHNDCYWSGYYGTDGQGNGWTVVDGGNVSLGHVTAGSAVFSLLWRSHWQSIYWASQTAILTSNAFTLTFVPDSPWTPAPTATRTNTPTATITPGGPTLTPTRSVTPTWNATLPTYTPTNIPYPPPGPSSTPAPSSSPRPTNTPCISSTGCFAPTAVPIVTLGPDTSPISPLASLSLARPACQPIGDLPAYTASLTNTGPYSFTVTVGLSVTYWSLPKTASGNDAAVIDPCHQLPSSLNWVWDFEYWIQVILLFIVFTLYQVRRFLWRLFARS